MGLAKTPTIDGLGRACLDVGVSTNRLVTATHGNGKRGHRTMGGRCNRCPLCRWTKAGCHIAPLNADAGLSVPRAAL